MSVGPFSGPVQRPSSDRDLAELFRRVEDLERQRPQRGAGTFLAGAVFNDADIIEGAGFTAEWADEDGSSPGLNLITIRFDVPFSEPGPVVALTPNNNNAAAVEGEYGVTLKTRDPAFIVVEGKEFDGTANIGGFDFLAVEVDS